MKRFCLYSFCLFFFILLGEYTNAQNASQGKVMIVPEPVMQKVNAGVFKLTSDVKIVIPANNKEVNTTAKLFAEQIAVPTGFYLKSVTTAGKSEKSINLVLNKVSDNAIGAEGYALSVKPSGITIRANKPAGIFNGIQTLLQLLPSDIVSKGKVSTTAWNIPCVEVTDYPRFGWRGLMLDVSRHFFSKEFVKKYIDQMAQYKFNVFHWHLSDNNGWRIEIKKYPKLTEVGAWRVPRTGVYGSYEGPREGEKATDGGFYTQEDIKEVVKYAQDRNITILPELDMPGHSMALAAAYPAVSCTQQQSTVYPGGGPCGDNVLCVGNEDNFTMIDDILTEVAALFPGKYIHIGGDEVDKGFWKACPKCQKRMKDEGLKNEEELQSYFITRLEKIVESKGKELIGWDEILEGGLAPGALVMSWRGVDGGIAAAKKGHYVVMSPTQYCYLDYMQADHTVERIGGGFLSISQVYKFEPVPDGVDPKFILGGQGNVWTEFIPNDRRVEYMTWPRAFALSETLWSPKEKRNWDNFVPRMEAQMKRYEKAKVNYAPSVYDPTIVPIKDKDGNMQLTFATEIKGLDVYYTFDCTFPDDFAAKYQQKPIDIPKGASEIWAITYRNGKPVGRLMIIGIGELKQRL
ncbi:MAG: family 20 glycosylhydrolase [Bacteroidota bacterium]|nr:family 20 glycosylhydrolase [Bacteroidota bacterium]MDP4206601.1 family 20 glycosylhydrolase [Bacteroidota bacterium]